MAKEQSLQRKCTVARQGRKPGLHGDGLERPATVRLVDQLRALLSGLPGVERSVSRFGSHRNPAWSVAGREFAHLHADNLLDLRLPRAVQIRLRSDPNAHFRKSRSEWLELEFHSVDDVARLAALARLAHTAARESSED